MNFIASALLGVLAFAADQPAKAAARQAVLTVEIQSQPSVTFTAEELAKLPRAKLQTGDGAARRTYEGPTLAEVVRAAGIGWGGNAPRGWTAT